MIMNLIQSTCELRGILLVLITFITFPVSSTTDRSCIPRTPLTRTRICSVKPSILVDGDPVLKWHDYPECETHSAKECLAYVGMTLTFKCSLSNAIYIYKDGKSVNTSLITYNNLQPEHAGEYECRVNSSFVLTRYNITVSAGEINIGLDEECSHFHRFIYNSTYDCCYDHGADITVHYDKWPSFLLFGMGNVSIRQEWLIPPEWHFHSDLGLYTEKDDSSNLSFSINVRNFPKQLNELVPRVLAILTASNNFTSNSVCVPLSFQSYGSPSITANDDLPKNAIVSEGNDAMFQCELGFIENSVNFEHIFQYYPVSDDNVSNSSWNRTCHGCQRNYSHNFSINGQHRYGFTCVSFGTVPSFKQYRYTFHIFNVSVKDHGSNFSCSIYSGGQFQWLHTANLTVYHRKTSVPANSSGKRFSYIYVIIPSLVVAVAIVVTVMIILVKKRRIRDFQVLATERVPLTDSSQCESEASTPVLSSMLSPILSAHHNGTKVPTLQVLIQNPAMNGILVGEPLPDGDQGYQSSQSLDDMSIGCQLKLMQVNSRCNPPNSLPLNQVSPNSSSLSKFSKSDSNILLNFSDIPKAETQTTNSSPMIGNCIVYISYTDKMASWVRNSLKPLIESWKHSEVRLHEDDMIPGFTISGERQRLILQAHKVVLVVSRDYSESPWCLYELQHAIQQEPALCRGRIIPILVDGCKTLPPIVRGVVPLMENDKNFSVRLKKNLMGSDYH